jgi:hypothetical protein
VDRETQEHWANQVLDAYMKGDETRMRTLCSRYEITLDEADPFKITINAQPHGFIERQAEMVQFEVVKANA